MDLKKELLEFVEANNWFSLEGRKNAEGVIDSYLKSYNKQLTLTDVSICYTEKDMDNAYDKGFKDGKNKEEFNLIKALTEFIDWYGCRDTKTDKILPIEQQEGIVVTAMTLLKEMTLTDVRRSVSYGHLLHYIEIQDSDIATIEALHDLLLDTHGYWVDFIALKRARELTAKMYKALY